MFPKTSGCWDFLVLFRTLAPCVLADVQPIHAEKKKTIFNLEDLSLSPRRKKHIRPIGSLSSRSSLEEIHLSCLISYTPKYPFAKTHPGKKHQPVNLSNHNMDAPRPGAARCFKASLLGAGKKGQLQACLAGLQFLLTLALVKATREPGDAELAWRLATTTQSPGDGYTWRVGWHWPTWKIVIQWMSCTLDYPRVKDI